MVFCSTTGSMCPWGMYVLDTRAEMVWGGVDICSCVRVTWRPCCRYGVLSALSALAEFPRGVVYIFEERVYECECLLD